MGISIYARLVFGISLDDPSLEEEVRALVAKANEGEYEIEEYIDLISEQYYQEVIKGRLDEFYPVELVEHFCTDWKYDYRHGDEEFTILAVPGALIDCDIGQVVDVTKGLEEKTPNPRQVSDFVHFVKYLFNVHKLPVEPKWQLVVKYSH